MRKIIMIMLAAVLVMSCSVTAWAAKPAVGEERWITPVRAEKAEKADGNEQNESAGDVWWTEEDVRMLGTLLEHESIHCGGNEAVYPMWCVLNRLSDTSGRFPNTIYGILTQPGQFMTSYGDCRESTKELVREQLAIFTDWQTGKNDYRPMPEGLIYYSGNGYYNIFRTAYDGGRCWAQGGWR